MLDDLDEERPHIELKRRGQVEEVASIIAFVCSDRASFLMELIIVLMAVLLQQFKAVY